MNQARYYSIRRFPPYQGTAQVVETPDFRAITTDGISWRVQFLNQRSRLSNNAVWRADDAVETVTDGRAKNFTEVMRKHPPFPFPPADNLELWLLDASVRNPLAILASTLDRGSTPRVGDTVWRAALEGDDSFTAPSLSSSPDGQVPMTPIPHSEVLNRCVQKAAGPLDRAQWFRRESDGSGTGLHGSRIDPEQIGRKLDRDAFPELLLREAWEDAREKNLVDDYHDWQAPNLLTHLNIKRDTRHRLELAACRQAEKLYRLRHFLPEIVNTDKMNVAFVEAVIRGSA